MKIKAESEIDKWWRAQCKMGVLASHALNSIKILILILQILWRRESKIDQNCVRCAGLTRMVWCGGGGSPCEIQAIKSNIGIGTVGTVQLDDGPIEQLANLN